MIEKLGENGWRLMAAAAWRKHQQAHLETGAQAKLKSNENGEKSGCQSMLA